MKKILTILLGISIFPLIVSAHEGHEHASNIPMVVEWGLKGARELINLHPLFTHFPIALLLSAFAFYSVGSVFQKEELHVAGKWLLYAGTVGSIFAVWTGLRAAGTVSHDEETHQIMMAHQYLGIAILILSALLSLWLLITKKNMPAQRLLFLGFLLLLSLLIVQQSDFGGRMVFLRGVGVGSKSMMRAAVEHSPHHDHE